MIKDQIFCRLIGKIIMEVERVSPHVRTTVGHDYVIFDDLVFVKFHDDRVEVNRTQLNALRDGWEFSYSHELLVEKIAGRVRLLNW